MTNKIQSGLAALDRGWSRLEVTLACGLVGLEVVALTLWVVLAGLASPVSSTSLGGWMVRALLGGTLGGLLAFGLSPALGRARALAGLAGLAGGFAVAPLWREFPVEYAANLIGWLQQASSLALFGGWRGIAARLTLILLFVGASLATRRNAHISIDLLSRSFRRSLRRWAAVATHVFSAALCVSTSWGFFDQVAISNFGAAPEATPIEKARTVAEGVSEHAFALRKQLELDLRSIAPVLILGRPYPRWLDGRKWNAWLASAGFERRYGAEAVRALRMPPDQYRAPMVVIPDVGEPRGELNRSADLVFPIGFAVLALRFLLAAATRAVEDARSTDSEDRAEAEPC